jgi:tRNA(Leu) C34 or U34 (ribose-2'-O)-methylase TrmL
MRGYFAIGMYKPKRNVNLGTLWRHAHAFGAAYIFTIGARYTPQASDTSKAWRHVPYFPYSDWHAFLASRPFDCPLIGIEYLEDARVLPMYTHPERAIYILGPEDGTLGETVLSCCQSVVRIPSYHCLNVAGAGTAVMYDRCSKRSGHAT